ncbi:sorbin-like domain-containing protein [Phthorimaea operculella]|nr:sorbin-like domain-containing protein [Phthorimaea operculella]
MNTTLGIITFDLRQQYNFLFFAWDTKLSNDPKNPCVREGQLPRGSNYLQDRESARLPRDRPSPPRGDPVHALRKEYASESEAEYRSSLRGFGRGGSSRQTMDAKPRDKVDGIGPTTKEGMPVALRSEVKDQSRWYKKMYDTIHKNKYDDDYVTIRYKNRRDEPLQRVSNKSQYAYFDPRSGYLSEPEGGRTHSRGGGVHSDYDSDVNTGPRRRTASVQEDRNEITSPYLPSNNKYSTLASARAHQEVYKNQPGRIENYVPGKSSVVDKEAKQVPTPSIQVTSTYLYCHKSIGHFVTFWKQRNFPV